MENDLKKREKENDDLKAKLEKVTNQFCKLNETIEKERSENELKITEKDKEINDLHKKIDLCIYIFNFSINFSE